MSTPNPARPLTRRQIMSLPEEQRTPLLATWESAQQARRQLNRAAKAVVSGPSKPDFPPARGRKRAKISFTSDQEKAIREYVEVYAQWARTERDGKVHPPDPALAPMVAAAQQTLLARLATQEFSPMVHNLSMITEVRREALAQLEESTSPLQSRRAFDTAQRGARTWMLGSLAGVLQNALVDVRQHVESTVQRQQDGMSQAMGLREGRRYRLLLEHTPPPLRPALSELLASAAQAGGVVEPAALEAHTRAVEDAGGEVEPAFIHSVAAALHRAPEALQEGGVPRLLQTMAAPESAPAPPVLRTPQRQAQVRKLARLALSIWSTTVVRDRLLPFEVEVWPPEAESVTHTFAEVLWDHWELVTIFLQNECEDDHAESLGDCITPAQREYEYALTQARIDRYGGFYAMLVCSLNLDHAGWQRAFDVFRFGLRSYGLLRATVWLGRLCAQLPAEAVRAVGQGLGAVQLRYQRLVELAELPAANGELVDVNLNPFDESARPLPQDEAKLAEARLAHFGEEEEVLYDAELEDAFNASRSVVRSVRTATQRAAEVDQLALRIARGEFATPAAQNAELVRLVDSFAEELGVVTEEGKLQILVLLTDDLQTATQGAAVFDYLELNPLVRGTPASPTDAEQFALEVFREERLPPAQLIDNVYASVEREVEVEFLTMAEVRNRFPGLRQASPAERYRYAIGNRREVRAVADANADVIRIAEEAQATPAEIAELRQAQAAVRAAKTPWNYDPVENCLRRYRYVEPLDEFTEPFYALERQRVRTTAWQRLVARLRGEVAYDPLLGVEEVETVFSVEEIGLMQTQWRARQVAAEEALSVIEQRLLGRGFSAARLVAMDAEPLAGRYGTRLIEFILTRSRAMWQAMRARIISPQLLALGERVFPRIGSFIASGGEWAAAAARAVSGVVTDFLASEVGLLLSTILGAASSAANVLLILYSLYEIGVAIYSYFQHHYYPPVSAADLVHPSRPGGYPGVSYYLNDWSPRSGDEWKQAVVRQTVLDPALCEEEAVRITHKSSLLQHLFDKAKRNSGARGNRQHLAEYLAMGREEPFGDYLQNFEGSLDSRPGGRTALWASYGQVFPCHENRALGLAVLATADATRSPFALVRAYPEELVDPSVPLPSINFRESATGLLWYRQLSEHQQPIGLVTMESSPAIHGANCAYLCLDAYFRNEERAWRSAHHSPGGVEMRQGSHMILLLLAPQLFTEACFYYARAKQLQGEWGVHPLFAGPAIPPHFSEAISDLVDTRMAHMPLPEWSAGYAEAAANGGEGWTDAFYQESRSNHRSHNPLDDRVTKPGYLKWTPELMPDGLFQKRDFFKNGCAVYDTSGCIYTHVALSVRMVLGFCQETLALCLERKQHYLAYVPFLRAAIVLLTPQRPFDTYDYALKLMTCAVETSWLTQTPGLFKVDSRYRFLQYAPDPVGTTPQYQFRSGDVFTKRLQRRLYGVFGGPFDPAQEVEGLHPELRAWHGYSPSVRLPWERYRLGDRTQVVENGQFYDAALEAKTITADASPFPAPHPQNPFLHPNPFDKLFFGRSYGQLNPEEQNKFAKAAFFSEGWQIERFQLSDEDRAGTKHWTTITGLPVEARDFRPLFAQLSGNAHDHVDRLLSWDAEGVELRERLRLADFDANGQIKPAYARFEPRESGLVVLAEVLNIESQPQGYDRALTRWVDYQGGVEMSPLPPALPPPPPPPPALPAPPPPPPALPAPPPPPPALPAPPPPPPALPAPPPPPPALPAPPPPPPAPPADDGGDGEPPAPPFEPVPVPPPSVPPTEPPAGEPPAPPFEPVPVPPPSVPPTEPPAGEPPAPPVEPVPVPPVLPPPATPAEPVPPGYPDEAPDPFEVDPPLPWPDTGDNRTVVEDPNAGGDGSVSASVSTGEEHFDTATLRLLTRGYFLALGERPPDNLPSY